MRDPEIRLFGKKIALPDRRVEPVIGGGDEFAGESIGGGDENSNGSVRDCCLDSVKQNNVEKEDEGREENQEESLKDDLADDACETSPREDHSTMEEQQNPISLSESESPSGDEGSLKSAKTENDQTDTMNSQQKPLKKPDKILPCPRCNSMDTKFCYYNNYNVNQPRYFCKSCQRYWTNGGTMRNVPVGAGRRKSKNSASHCQQITITEALQAARIDPLNGYNHPAFQPNGTVLSFGANSPLCESMLPVLNVSETKSTNGIQNGFHKLERAVSSGKSIENGDDCCKSSITNPSSTADGSRNGLQENPPMHNINGSPCPVPFIPWPFPWNAAVPFQAICPSPIPMPFYPAPYWNCSVPNAWSSPWISPPSLATNQKGSGTGPSSPLGKHSRDGDLLKPSNPSNREASEGSIVVPKTLRIDDPDEAAKSSIWSTLGIKYDAVNKGGLFKAFQPKGDDKTQPMATTSPVLQANPAALSRSISFLERA